MASIRFVQRGMVRRVQPEDLIETTIDTLQAKMSSGSLSAEELALLYIQRIATADTGPGGVNAVLEINPDAVGIAAALDRERATRGTRGPLHGIPVLLKDNINTGDRMHTSAGSWALGESYAPEDSHVARRLRAAGAVILGKANMTEWANFMTENMPNGYSSRGGQVRNPYGPFNVGGSSSGSAAAAAANLTAVAVGTETSGSILSPSGQNSIVGIKPTVGLVSRTGIIPIAWSQDTAGPMARTVTDAAILLGALQGVDGRDSATATSVGRTHSDYRPFLDARALEGARIGVPRTGYADALESSQAEVFDRLIGELQQAGAVIVDPISLPDQEDLGFTVLLYEFKPALNAYLARLDARVGVRTLRDLIACNAQDPVRMLRHGQTVLVDAEAKSGSLREPEYITARLRDLRLSRTEGIDRAMAVHHLDALLFGGAYGSAIAACAGYPSVSVPAGYTREGQPVGATFTAGAFSEPTLIALAYAYEQATHHRRSPLL